MRVRTDYACSFRLDTNCDENYAQHKISKRKWRYVKKNAYKTKYKKQIKWLLSLQERERETEFTCQHAVLPFCEYRGLWIRMLSLRNWPHSTKRLWPVCQAILYIKTWLTSIILFEMLCFLYQFFFFFNKYYHCLQSLDTSLVCWKLIFIHFFTYYIFIRVCISLH